MELNPFIEDFPVECTDEWIGDKTLIKKLEYSVKNRVNTYVVGPEGSGKTSLLRTTFSPEYRKKIAETKKKLIYFADLSTRSDSNDLCEYLAERLEKSLGFLISDKELLAQILETTAPLNGISGKTKFQNMIEEIHDNWGYFVIIVMDYFEMFTLSSNVTQEHHDCLRSLIESGYIQCIVATNYDLTKDSLPKDVRGSYFLQKFTNVIEMSPFSQEDVRSYLNKKQEGSDLVIPDTMNSHIFNLSGGIPKFVNLLAKQIYENILSNNGEVNIGGTVKSARFQCEILMDGWSKLLTDTQIKVLKMLAAQASSNKDYACCDFTASPYEEAVAALLQRGLLRRYIYQDRNKNLISRDFLVRFNSLLFQRYCREDKMTAASKRNPLQDIENKKMQNLPMDRPTIVVNGDYYENGSANESKEVKIQNMQYVQGISAKEFLLMLGDSSDQEELGLLIGSRLQRHIQSKFDPDNLRQVLELPYESEEEHDRLVDQTFHDAGKQIFPDIEVDEYEDIVDVTESELQTLDERFVIARNRIHHDLKDEILEKQSVRCQFYLKMAVVVEDALSLPHLDFDDYSAQLILYGKAVEQALRDNLFAAFQGISALSEYSLKEKANIPAARDNFKHMNVSKTYIGNFANLISGKKICLADLCASITFHLYGGTIPEDWGRWWDDLASGIHRAREIRNLAGHADHKSPEKDKVQEMFELLFGADCSVGILDRILAGRDLCLQYVVLSIDPKEAEKIIGQSLEMKCIKQKTNGGIRGKLIQNGYEVNISPRKVNKYEQENRLSDITYENRLFMVKILEFKHDSNKDFFVGEIDSMI